MRLLKICIPKNNKKKKKNKKICFQRFLFWNSVSNGSPALMETRTSLTNIVAYVGRVAE